MQLSTKDVNALGQITQRGWGVPSTPNSIICSLHNDSITMKYMTIVHFAAESALRNQVERINEESIQLLTKYVAEVKKQFREATGKSIKLKEITNNDSLEMISATNLSPRRIAYYRRQVTLQII